MSERLLTLRKRPVQPEKLGFFRFGKIGEKFIVTNDAGDWQLLEPADFQEFSQGRVEPGHRLYAELHRKGFLREGIDLEDLAARIRRKKAFVGVGPHLHIVITTLRCNQTCRYCHASRTNMDRVDTDMSLETAKRVVDLAMTSTSPYINFEFQGGEPTVNFPAIEFIVAYSREKNRYEKKRVEHSLVTNMTYMTDERADWLVANELFVCTSLDGPEDLHNWNRLWTKDGNAFQKVTGWIKAFNQRYVDRGLDPNLWHVDALMTTTRKTFEHWKELVDLYVDLGIRNIHLRPLNPYGFALDTWKNIGYTIDEYLEFYAKTLDYILQLNRQGVEIMEGTASVFLQKMLTPDDPNHVDMRSPCGAGTGQVAYNYDGKIFTCDEGRMVSAMGNDAFQIGSTSAVSFDEVVGHPTVRTMAMASLQDSLPSCSTCWNKPYCGVCPMHNYMTAGDLYGQRPRSPKCKEHYTIASVLLERLASDDTGEVERIFRRWTQSRQRAQSTECSV